MRIYLLTLVVTACVVVRADASPEHPAEDDRGRTNVHDQNAKQRILGRHLLSLQWIGWDNFGSARVREERGQLTIKGEQRKGDDYLTVDGIITSIDARSFDFDGTIVTRVSFNNHGEPCTRHGRMTFEIKGKRRYWRLQQMDNPCEEVTDYVDVYLRN